MKMPSASTILGSLAVCLVVSLCGIGGRVVYDLTLAPAIESILPGAAERAQARAASAALDIKVKQGRLDLCFAYYRWEGRTQERAEGMRVLCEAIK